MGISSKEKTTMQYMQRNAIITYKLKKCLLFLEKKGKTSKKNEKIEQKSTKK